MLTNKIVNQHFLVIPAGFEPTTHSLEGCCSIQLSYETNFQLGVRSDVLEVICNFQFSILNSQFLFAGAKLRNFSDISIYLA